MTAQLGGVSLRYDVLAVAAFLVLAVVVGLGVVQWLRFSRAMGSFRCFVRLPDSAGPFAGWRRGVAKFDPTVLRWFPVYVLVASRSLVVDRGEFELQERRSAGPEDGLPSGLSVVRGTVRGVAVELALPVPSASALVLWVESGPPGRGVNVA